MKNLLILVVALLAVSLLVGCNPSVVEYYTKTNNTEIKGTLKAFNSEELKNITIQLGTVMTVADTTLSSYDRALQLTPITSMKDRDVQIIVPYGNYGGGHYGYQGSRQQTQDMQIDALIRYQQYKQKQLNK